MSDIVGLSQAQIDAAIEAYLKTVEPENRDRKLAQINQHIADFRGMGDEVIHEHMLPPHIRKYVPKKPKSDDEAARISSFKTSDKPADIPMQKPEISTIKVNSMPKPIRENIVAVITGAEQGAVIDEANDKLPELVEAVVKNGGKGTLKLIVEVALIKGKEAVTVAVSLEMKKPKPTAMTRPYFFTDEFRLSRKHGAQPDMLPDHDPDTGELTDENVTKLRPQS